MDIDKAVQKALDELKTQNSYLPIHENLVRQYLSMMYAIGYDEGRQKRATSHPILQLNKFGKPIDTFESAAAAERKTSVSATHIIKVCKGRAHTAGKYFWKYADSVNQVKERKTA